MQDFVAQLAIDSLGNSRSSQWSSRGPSPLSTVGHSRRTPLRGVRQNETATASYAREGIAVPPSQLYSNP